ncbi:MAG: hypothetical protein SGJ27_00540 [Candidatus Melainabacteria bacterium]|nr:hypothetical protein [Candidatus Melainabacteria bacterium]
MKQHELLRRTRIPPGFILHIPHGGKPELRRIDGPQTETLNQDADEDAEQQQALLEKALRLGIVSFDTPIETWSIEHLKGAIFERLCRWTSARRAGIRGLNRRWSDHAMFVAMVKAKRLEQNARHRP